MVDWQRCPGFPTSSSKMAELDTRLGRIEKRLQLSDPSLSPDTP
jgi:hypothetical protein